MNAPYRPTQFGDVSVTRIDRGDGTTLFQSRLALPQHATRFTERLTYWATHAPERTFLARRDAAGNWNRLTYAQTLARVRGLAQALLDRGLDAQHPIAILSENSLEHALLALAALHVGIPYAPISPPYSLVSTDFGKLRHTLGLMTPGLVFAQSGAGYARALAMISAEFATAELVTATPGFDGKVAAFSALLDTVPTAAVDAAHARVSAETVAKVLFTSGSTGMPKGVINTHGMWCANLTQITQIMPFMAQTPPLIVDWLPWNHTFGGNHNVGLVLHNGGSFYIDDGKPTPAGIETTVANLRELSPTMYFNVPRGFEELLRHLRREPALRERFFSQLEMMFFAGAALPQAIWDGLDEMAVQTTGRRVPMTTGLGMTESGPGALFAYWPGAYSGLLGCPVAGLDIKLVTDGDKREVRYRGPNVTPGYWRQPEATAAAFDEEGFFKTGDAVKFEVEAQPARGLVFDGRIAEDFKLDTGTWVNVGVLRAAIMKAGAPLVTDAVIAGPNRRNVAALLFLNIDACRALAGAPATVMMPELARHPAVRARVQQILQTLADAATGSANLITRACISVDAPSLDVGEITDKGSLNQRVILRHRAATIDALYVPHLSAEIFTIEKTS